MSTEGGGVCRAVRPHTTNGESWVFFMSLIPGLSLCSRIVEFNKVFWFFHTMSASSNV